MFKLWPKKTRAASEQSALPELQPASTHTALDAGRALHRSGKLQAAEDIYRQVLERDGDNPDANYLLGAILFQRGDFVGAIERLDRSISVDSGRGDAYFNRGNALRELMQFQAAVDSYDTAIRLRPTDAQAICNRGVALQALERHEEALASFQQATLLDASYAIGFYHLGNAQQDRDDVEGAISSYQRALELNPKLPFLPGVLLNLKMRVCDWREFNHDLANLTALITRGEKATPALIWLALSDSLQLQQRVAAIWSDERAGHVVQEPYAFASPEAGRIRIGYYSADLHDHATAFLIAELFETHDRERFELFAFTWGPDSSGPMRKRLVSAFDHFIDIRFKSDAEVVAMSRELGIDIAIDLKGHTAQGRPGIFARRAAAVQAAYLGFPGTSSLSCIDYLIADHAVVPPQSRPFYSEALAYLPDSYQSNDSTRSVTFPMPSRAEVGLPENGFVFCSFNNNYKILPETFDSWMRILDAVPQSVLWTFEDNHLASRNLREEARARGVDAKRLVFAPRKPLAEHLARQQLGDLFLDTYPYNAHTTASDALWVGLPLVTLTGPSFASRVAASLLRAVELEELVTNSRSAYESLAIDLACDAPRLSAIRQHLMARRHSLPLFDTKRFAQNFEHLLAQMHSRRLANLPPADLEVKASDSAGT